MSGLVERLRPNQRKGSKARCHLLTHGTAVEVAERLSSLITPYGVVTPQDRWMPQGFEDPKEAQLHEAPCGLKSEQGASLKSWWLAASGLQSMTPNWDIASSCTIEGRSGIVLIEAKAHDNELINEEGGKALKAPVTVNSRRNHVRIGACIQDASLALSAETGIPWGLSRDWNYQMANRFTWAWKLTELGYPVILVYLAFLNADEMCKHGKPFPDSTSWEQLVQSHSAPLFPGGVWNARWMLNERPFVPLIRAIEQPLDVPTAGARR